jgi:uncharacterized membrane protein
VPEQPYGGVVILGLHRVLFANRDNTARAPMPLLLLLLPLLPLMLLLLLLRWRAL